MRFQRLDLTRYGKFTDRQIVFGEKQEGVPDLHVVYGPNEAGKSTSLTAMMDLLFGIQPQSPYNFLHDYKSMRIGALLEMADGPREVVRLKRNSPSLFDANLEPLSDGLLATILGGMSREAYQAMFSLDDETLEKGGESILASQGDLGQLLFSASAGLAGFSKALTGLRQMTDSFTKPSGRGTELAALKDELVQLSKARDEIDIRVNEYAKLVEQRDIATGTYKTLLGDRARLERTIEKLERQMSAQPLLRELLDIRSLVAPMAAIPDAPQSWGTEIRELEHHLTVLSTQITLREKRIHDLDADLDTIIIDPAAIQLDPQVQALDPLHARYLTAQIDIPKLEAQHREIERDIHSLTVALGQQDRASPNELILTSATVATLRHLMEARSGLDAALATARKERDGAEEQLEALNTGRGKETQFDPAGMSRLSSQLAIARSQDHDQRVKAAEISVQKQSLELQTLLKSLLPWSGNGTALEAISVPSSDEISRWKNSIKTLEARAQLATSEREKAEAEFRRLDAEYGVLKQSLGAVSDLSAEQTRAEREASWHQHRQILTSESATAFESLMRQDDQAWAARLIRSSDLARLMAIESSRAVIAVDLESTSRTLSETAETLAAVQSEMQRFWKTVSPDSDQQATPERIEVWGVKREAALRAAATSELLQFELQTAVNDRQTTKSRLANALSEQGVEIADADLSALINAAQAIVDGFAFQKAELEKRADAERNLARRQAALAKAEAELIQWQAEWDAIGNKCWLGSGNSIPVIREWLTQLAKLGPALDVKSNLTDRIEKMRADQTAFSHRLQGLALQLGMPFADHDPGLAWQALNERTQKAKKLAEMREKTENEIGSEKRALEELKRQRDGLETEKTRYCSHFAAENLEQASLKLEDLNRRNTYLAQVNKLERQLTSLLETDTIETVEQVLGELDSNAMALEISRLKSEKADQDQRIQELYAAKVKAEDRVDSIGGDDEVARIEEKKRTILADIEDRALTYVKLRSGILAAEQALRIYREEHRSAMMRRASEAFRMISRGAYKGLSAQPDKDTEILIANAADGSSKIAKDMSKGTRFQLYLALRMAGYHEFAATRGSVPFLADDIMETFDDFRAEETFRLLADMASVGQVIYFTHHRHLCDIAKSVSPDVKIHSL